MSTYPNNTSLKALQKKLDELYNEFNVRLEEIKKKRRSIIAKAIQQATRKKISNIKGRINSL